MPNTITGSTEQDDRRSMQRNSFFRSIGIEIPFIFGYGKGQGEAPKKVIDTTRQKALARCGVHILPVLVSLLIISLNCGHTYLGRTIPGSILDPSINIAFLQVVAKIQELAIVASVTTVVIHVLRSELVEGEGVPLGLLGGGFMFTALSYFWSPEFWGSTYTRYSWTARTKVYGILLIGGIIAALAGPSTAVLSIPENQPWDAGGTSIFLPGNIDQLTPSVLRLDREALGTDCTSAESVNTPTCPSGGFSSIWSMKDAINIYKRSTFTQDTARNLTTRFSFGSPLIHIPSSSKLLPTIEYSGVYRGLACETSTRGPRALEIMYQRHLMLDWAQEAYSIPYQPFKYGPTLVEYKYYGTMAAVSDSRLPAVRVACTAAQNVTSSDTSVAFPSLPQSGCPTTTHNKLLQGILSANESHKDQARSTWMSLPSSVGVTSTGFVLEMPWDKASSSRPVVGCSIDARWTNGSILTSEVWSSPTGSFTDGGFVPVVSTSLLKNPASTLFGQTNYSEFRPVMMSPSTQTVELEQSWLKALTPIMAQDGQEGSSSLTTLEKLLTDIGLTTPISSGAQTATQTWNLDVSGEVNRTVALEWWLALFIIDGMTRTGSARAINKTGSATSWDLVNYNRRPDFQQRLFAGNTAFFPPNSTTVENRIKITIGGYSYMANTITDWLSIALLILHIILAISHTTYCISTGRSSSAWDSLTELLILMQNSSQAPTVLGNTNAGIRDILTYSRRARIYSTTTGVSHPPNEDELSNVELIFDDDTPPRFDAVASSFQSELPNADHRSSNAYRDHFYQHNRTTSLAGGRSRGDSTTSTSSKAPPTFYLERLRSNSRASDMTTVSNTTLSRMPVPGRVRPGVAYGHSPTAIGAAGSLSTALESHPSWSTHRVNGSMASGLSETQRLI